MKYFCIKDYHYAGLDGPRKTFTKGQTYTQVNTTLQGNPLFIDDEHDKWPFDDDGLIKHFRRDFKFGK